MTEYCFNALGTRWVVESIEKPLTKNCIGYLNSEVTRFEKSYSRFRHKSFIDKLNATHRLVNPPQELVAMLHYALKTYTKTDGLFNISVGAELEKRGYGLVHDTHTSISSNLVNEILVTNELITLAPHIRIDFGGFGKGWLIDTIHHMLQESNYESFCINGGGDIRIGNQPLDVVIEHPLDANQFIYTIRLQPNHALAVSSKQKRQWIDKDGKKQNHIINTGLVNNHNLLQVAICAASATTADTFATVFFGADNSHQQQFAKDNKLEYMVVFENNAGQLSTLKSKFF